MVKKNKLFHNNKGSTLILVIVSIGFISILSTLLLSLTVSNIEMKKINQSAKLNFYDTESALDEIKSGIEQVCAKALEKTYYEVMKQYTDHTIDKKQVFAKQYINELQSYFVDSIDHTKYDRSILEDFIKTTSAKLDQTASNNLLIMDPINMGDPSYEPKYITLKNIKVCYKDANNFSTTIQADIIIHTPDLSFDTVPTNQNEFSEYSLIADHMISLNTASSVHVYGNVYAGEGGISLVNASNLQIDSISNLVTRGDISVDKSSLKILDTTTTPSIWAKNIVTEKGIDNNTSLSTTVLIKGKCYVADDLNVNAKNSDVTITGEYYGYNYYPNTSSYSSLDQAKNSSSIIINGSNTILNLDTDKLLIAGRAYLDTSSMYGGENKVPTGESLAIKGNQYAYLVPEDCMFSGTNPVTIENYQKAVAEGKTQVTYDETLKKYVSNTGEGFTRMFYRPTLGNNGLVYYYIDFASEEKANDYLREEYYKNNNYVGLVDNRIHKYANQINIKGSISSMISVGNIFTFTSNVEDGTFDSTIIPNNVKVDGTNNAVLNALKQLSASISKKYNGLQTSLNEFSSKELEHTPSLFETIIDTDQIEQDELAGNVFDSDGVKCVTVAGYSVYIVENESNGKVFKIPQDMSLPDGGRCGIVIATGPVEVPANCTYTGLILSKDRITLGSGATVKASKSVVDAILLAGHEEVNRYFIGYDSISGGTLNEEPKNINVSDLIVYENWKKNED